jgi:hypothetical protein
MSGLHPGASLAEAADIASKEILLAEKAEIPSH